MISVQPSYGQERGIRERSIASNSAVEHASRPWLRDGDETVLDSVTSLMKYCTLQYKSLLSEEMQALYKSLDMNVHFIQEAGYLPDSKHTYVVLLDICSVVQYIKNGNGVLLSVRLKKQQHSYNSLIYYFIKTLSNFMNGCNLFNRTLP